MNKQFLQVKEFHAKFKVPILENFRLIPEDRFDLRFSLLKEENEEYLQACKEKNLIKVADSLADMLYVLYGTIIEHGFEEKIKEVFDEIHKSNMSKNYSEGKMIKGKNYFKPDIQKLI